MEALLNKIQVEIEVEHNLNIVEKGMVVCILLSLHF